MNNTPFNEAQDKDFTNSTIKNGTLIHLKNNPTKNGVVTECIGKGSSLRYKVFINNELLELYPSQIEISLTSNSPKNVSLNQFKMYLTKTILEHPSTSHLYSFNNSKIDFIPYQYKPVIKAIQSEQPRILIADGVGVGKTIETGIILKELKARQQIESVLIICPKPLVLAEKWYYEMLRFDEKFEQLDGKGFRYCLDECNTGGEWPLSKNRVVIPYSLFNETSIDGKVLKNGQKTVSLLNLDTPPKFDLVIVDEAHHIRNTGTYVNKAVRHFCDFANAAIFLTATPLQMCNHDLYVLLNVLRPDLIDSYENFQEMCKPNQFINEALSHIYSVKHDWQNSVSKSLNHAIETEWGRQTITNNPSFYLCKELLKEQIEKNDHEKRVELTQSIENLNIFSNLINRTRRNDVESFCTRHVKTMEIPLTEEQRHIYKKILCLRERLLMRIHNTDNVNMIMSTIKRQTTSCVFGLAPYIKSIVNANINGKSLIDNDSMNVELPISMSNKEIQGFQTEADTILYDLSSMSNYDPKLEKLKEILEGKRILDNKKVMIFSTFRLTLQYLYKKLKYAGFKVGMIHGGVKDSDRISLRNRFESNPEDENSLDVMLFSEIGCEGLDFQFCDTMVNYDLPWNPMSIEQRIGRIDRRDQKSKVVVIYNFITPNTIDGEIYNRCLKRIGIFEESVGICDTILVDTFREIRDVGTDFTLTDSEVKSRLDKISENKIRLIKEQNNLENNQKNLFTNILPQDIQKKKILAYKNHWLSPRSLRSFVKYYLSKRLAKDDTFLLDSTLRLNKDDRLELLIDFHKLSTYNPQTYTKWKQWLQGSNPICHITFDNEIAKQNNDYFFIDPLHPVIQQAIHFFSTKQPMSTSFAIVSNKYVRGRYPYSLYTWEYHRFVPDIKLIPVCMNKNLARDFLSLIETTSNSSLTESTLSRIEDEELEHIHFNVWSDEMKKEKELMRMHCDYKKEMIKNSLKKRISFLDKKITKSQNEKITRMYESEKNRHIVNNKKRIEQIENAYTRFDIIKRKICSGYIEVINLEEIKNEDRL